MHRDIHLSALNAAARVAFSLAFLGGCSSAASNEPSSTSDSDLRAKKDTCEDDAGPGPSCQDIVDEAFPTPSGYPGKKQDVSAEVAACCSQLLEDGGASNAHRWDCCANADTRDSKINMACTPWGPPVPPAMPRRASALGVA